MKRIICSITTLSLILSLTACGPRTTIGKRNNNMNINQGSASGNNINYQNVVYRDGVYSATGDAHANGNENATVAVRNGRIADVALASFTNQGNVSQNNTGSEPDIGNMNISGNPGLDVNQGTGAGYGQYRTNVNSATDSRNNNLTNMGTAAGSSNLEQLKSRLSAAVLEKQSADVNLDGVDGNLSTTFNNWKLAVRRALDQAK